MCKYTADPPVACNWSHRCNSQYLSISLSTSVLLSVPPWNATIHCQSRSGFYEPCNDVDNHRWLVVGQCTWTENITARTASYIHSHSHTLLYRKNAVRSGLKDAIWSSKTPCFTYLTSTKLLIIIINYQIPIYNSAKHTNEDDLQPTTLPLGTRQPCANFIVYVHVRSVPNF